jgi:hypothetical protein
MKFFLYYRANPLIGNKKKNIMAETPGIKIRVFAFSYIYYYLLTLNLLQWQRKKVTLKKLSRNQ